MRRFFRAHQRMWYLTQVFPHLADTVLAVAPGIAPDFAMVSVQGP